MPFRDRGGVEVGLYSFFTSALDGVGVQGHDFCHTAPKSPFPIVREAGWAAGSVWRKIISCYHWGSNPGPSSR